MPKHYAESICFFFSSRRRHTRCYRDWSSDVCSSDLSGSKVRVSCGGTTGVPLGDAMQLEQDVLLGERYRLVRMVGSGGMGTVWEAEDEILGRPVAVKVLSESLGAEEHAVRRFEREARAAARLSGPHIAAVYDFGRSEGRPYIVMELIRGETLADRLAREGPLPPQEAARIATQVAEALEEAHAAGIVHRDVKPGNVMLTT